MQGTACSKGVQNRATELPAAKYETALVKCSCNYVWLQNLESHLLIRLHLASMKDVA